MEHITVPGFLRRVPHRWHLDEITRFGDKVGRVAESLQIAYLTTVDRSLGVIRIFPAPLLQRVYDILAAQFGWPKAIDAEIPTLPDGSRAPQSMKAHERMVKHLRVMLGAVQEMEVQHSIAVILNWLETDMQRMQAEAAAQSTAQASS